MIYTFCCFNIFLLLIIIIFFTLKKESKVSTNKKNKQTEFNSKTFFQKWYEIADQIADTNSRMSIGRYGDGEYMMMVGTAFKGRDRFSYKGGESVLKDELLDSLKCPKGGVCYYGIWYDHINEFMKWGNIDPKYIVTANIFINKNYPKTKLLLESLIYDEEKRIILFCNSEAKNVNFAEIVYYFPDDILNYYEKNHDIIVKNATSIAKRYNNRLFIFSIGPISQILMKHMMLANLNNRYIDFGSCIDEITKGKVTREYVDQNSYYGKLIDKPFKIFKNKSIIVG